MGKEEKNKEIQVSISYRISKITTKEFATYDEHIPNNLNESGYKMDMRFLGSDSNVIGVQMDFYGRNKKKDDKVFVEIKTICSFEIIEESFKNLKTDNDGHTIIPEAFALNIASISLGITRGILHSKTNGTRINDYIIPIINLGSIIDSDFKLEPIQDKQTHK